MIVEIGDHKIGEREVRVRGSTDPLKFETGVKKLYLAYVEQVIFDLDTDVDVEKWFPYVRLP